MVVNHVHPGEAPHEGRMNVDVSWEIHAHREGLDRKLAGDHRAGERELVVVFPSQGNVRVRCVDPLETEDESGPERVQVRTEAFRNEKDPRVQVWVCPLAEG